jgi:hypothetical protein
LEICALRKSAAILKKPAQQGAGSRSLDWRRGLDEYLFIFCFNLCYSRNL